jgi:hypothetical protein
MVDAQVCEVEGTVALLNIQKICSFCYEIFLYNVKQQHSSHAKFSSIFQFDSDN